MLHKYFKICYVSFYKILTYFFLNEKVNVNIIFLNKKSIIQIQMMYGIK